MSRSRRRSHSKKVGMPPGSLVHVGEVKATQAELSLFRYDAGQLTEQSAASLAGLDLHRSETETLWLNLHGLQDAALMAELGKTFGLHPLVMEDILNTDQRPKLDSYGDYQYFVARFFSYDKATLAIGSEQVSIILGRNFVLTFQERRSGSFDPVRERIRRGSGRIRTVAADYLGYSLVDALVDRFFPLLEGYAEELEHLEAEVVRHPTAGMVREIYSLKRELLGLRRMIWPVRDAIATLPGDWFDRPTLAARLAEHASGRRDHGRLLWSLLVLEHWRRRHDVAGLAS